MWFLLACTAPTEIQKSKTPHTDDSATTGDSGTSEDSADTADTGDTSIVSGLSLPSGLALPYLTAGDKADEGTLSLQNLGDRTEALTIQVEGAFSVDADLSPMEAQASRALQVHYTGDTKNAGIAEGSITVIAGDQHQTAWLSIVIGDPELPSASWKQDESGSWTILSLPSAPYPYSGRTYTDDSVAIYVPDGLSAEAVPDVVTWIHGHNAHLTEIIADEYLFQLQALSGRNAVLVIPQGPYEAADSYFGRLEQKDAHLNLVRDALTVAFRDHKIAHPGYGLQVLASHSGGYECTAQILEHGGLPITAVHLFDSLYGYEDTFADFARAGGVFRSNYTSSGGTDNNNEDLAKTLTAAGLKVQDSFWDADLDASPVTIAWTDSAHGDTMWNDQNESRFLRSSGLPPRPGAPPVLRSTILSGDAVSVNWQADGRTLRVEGSDDGQQWSLLDQAAVGPLRVPPHPYLRLIADEPGAAPSDIYGATGKNWLVVDGFDRVLDGSYTLPTHAFAAAVGNSFGGAGFSAAHHEAVADGSVDLSDYAAVLWILGDEGLADRTFDEREQATLKRFVDGGGRLIVSGAEVGYATDSSWFSQVLHASYVSDDAKTNDVENWSFGTEYTEDYPDVLSGSTVLWSYATGGAAAVGWSHQVVVVGFGLENMSASDRADALASLSRWLGL